MPKLDRGMIKWQPFNSVVSSKVMINELLNEKNKIVMPNLSEEQKNNLEQKIIIAYYEKENIHIDYFYQGKIFNIYSKIKKIDFTFHKIYLNNKTLIFEQIIKVY